MLNNTDYSIFSPKPNPPPHCSNDDLPGVDSVERFIHIWKIRSKIMTLIEAYPDFRINEAVQRAKALISRHPDCYNYIYFHLLISSSPGEMSCDKWDFDGEDSIEHWLDQKIEEIKKADPVDE